MRLIRPFLFIVVAQITLISCAQTDQVKKSASQQAPLAISELRADSGFARPALANCETDLRFLNQVGGWQVSWPRQWAGTVAAGGESSSAPIDRWIAAPEMLDNTVAMLRSHIGTAEVAPRSVVLRVHQQTVDLAAQLVARSSPYVFNGQPTEGQAQWNQLIRHRIAPAVTRFHRFLEDTYLPAAQPLPGLSAINNGAACFSHAVLWWNTINPAPADMKQLGRRILAQTRAGLAATGKDGQTFEDVLAELRSYQADNKTTGEQIIALSDRAINRARSAVSAAFLSAATHDIQVVEMPKHVQASFPAGRYISRQGSGGSASYSLNTSRPNERRIMAEVIAFHEGIPGHHLFAAYPRAEPLSGYNSGFLEGWAIYAEYLSAELGLYSTRLDRRGRLAKHLWAASRLLVEPGLHVDGWTREQAIEFMLSNTILSRTEIEIEVDRYIAMPGQSLSYMLGANFILSQRKRAWDVLGERFDLASFHHQVLSRGVQTLPELRDNISAWIAETSE